MTFIGLIAAMPQESAALLKYVKGWKRIALGRFDCKSFELHGHNCLLVTSGMGIRGASEATRELIATGVPQMLISFGIAGAVEADLEIGDVVAVEAVCQLEQGVAGPLLALNHWPEGALEAASRVLAARNAHIYAGTAVTTGGSQVMKNQLGGMKHPILEMETAGIAQVAAEKGIPVRSLRAISDGPRAPIPIDLGEIMDEDANLRIGRMLLAVLRKPRIIFQSRGVMRNTRLAADNAAMALVAALSEIAVHPF